jgi:hypothetical protein
MPLVFPSSESVRRSLLHVPNHSCMYSIPTGSERGPTPPALFAPFAPPRRAAAFQFGRESHNLVRPREPGQPAQPQQQQQQQELSSKEPTLRVIWPPGHRDAFAQKKTHRPAEILADLNGARPMQRSGGLRKVMSSWTGSART